MASGSPVSESDVIDIAREVRALVWSLRRFGERQSGLPALPHSELEVLRVVVSHEGTTVSDVARMLGLHSSNVSTTVRRLIDKGLLARDTDPGDRRSSRLHSTATARRHGEMIDDVWIDAIGRRLAAMSAEDAALLTRAAPLLAHLTSMPTEP